MDWISLMLLYGLFHQAVVVSSLLLIIASIALTNRLFMCLKIAGSSSFFFAIVQKPKAFYHALQKKWDNLPIEEWFEKLVVYWMKLSTKSEIENRVITVVLQTIKNCIDRTFKNSSNLLGWVVDIMLALFHNRLSLTKTHLLKKARNE